MLLDQLARAGQPVYSVGKIFDVFLGRGIGEHVKTKNNADGMAKTLDAMQLRGRRPDLRQPGRFRSAVRPSQRRGRLRRARSKQFDAWLPGFERNLSERDLAIITADHGCDPDHALDRPLAANTCRCWPSDPERAGVPLGLRATLSDLGQTVAENFGMSSRERNQFLTGDRMRKPVMAGNWKMYKTAAETTAFFEKFRPRWWSAPNIARS